MNLRALHRRSALVLVAFLLLHLFNHVCMLAGVQAHLDVMELVRSVYRQPVVETLLLACAAFQASSGVWMLIRGWRQRSGFVAWAQALSGAYLALFLLNHVGAVLYGRWHLGLDTNFYFAAAGLHVPPLQWFFGPYYLLAVWALLTHLGCALYWQWSASRPGLARLALVTLSVAGGMMGALFVAGMAGAWEPVQVPSVYLSTYGAYPE